MYNLPVCIPVCTLVYIPVHVPVRSHSGMCVPTYVRTLKAYPSRYLRSHTPTGAVGLGYSIAIVVHSYVRTYDQVCTVASQELLAVTVKLATRTYVRTMPRRLSLYARQRARELMAQGASVKETTECLHKEGIFPCHQTVWRFKRHYDKHGSIEPLRSSGRPTKLTD